MVATLDEVSNRRLAEVVEAQKKLVTGFDLHCELEGAQDELAAAVATNKPELVGRIILAIRDNYALNVARYVEAPATYDPISASEIALKLLSEAAS